MHLIAFVILALLTMCSPPAYAQVVDPHPPTGVLNPAVTQATIGETICVPGWAASVRPPAAYTRRLKRLQLPVGAKLKRWEEDHVLPISSGGSPTDPNNLRPQLWAGKDGAHAKDRVENREHRAICHGRETLAQGQANIAAWIVAHQPYPVVRGGDASPAN